MAQTRTRRKGFNCSSPKPAMICVFSLVSEKVYIFRRNVNLLIKQKVKLPRKHGVGMGGMRPFQSTFHLRLGEGKTYYLEA